MSKRRIYKDVAERVIVAVTELNAAFAEAAEHPQVRVHFKYPKSDTPPLQYGCEVTRITKHVVPVVEEQNWQLAYRIAEKTGAAKKRKRKIGRKAS